MSLQEGQNAGVTGLLNLPAAGVKFQGQVLKWETDISAALMDAAGRGDSEWPEQRPLSSSGFLSISGLTNLDGYPIPTKYRGELGTIVLQQTTSVTQTYPVRVRSTTFEKKTKETGLWPFTHVCQVVSDPTFAGYGGTQTASTNETFSDKFLWPNLMTRVDPDGIDGLCIRPILIWGIGDTDAAEKTKIDTILAALIAPYAGMKVRAGNFRRLSKNACIIDAEFRYTTSAEDILNAATFLTVDPRGRTSEAVTAVFNGTPSASAGLVVRGLTTKEYNDNKILYTKQHGTRSTIEDLTFGNTKTTHDVSALSEEDLICLSFATGSPPGDPSPPEGKVITGYFDVPDTSPDSTNLSYRVYILSFTSNEQKLTLARYEFEMDPNDLNTVLRSAVVYDSDVEVPPDPDLPDGLKLDAITDLGIPSHPTKQIRVYRWMKTDSIDRLVNPHNWTMSDPNDITSNGERAAVNSTPSVPGGYKSRGTRAMPQDDDNILNVTEIGKRNTADDIIHGGTVSRTRSFEGTTADTVSLLASSNTAAFEATQIFNTYKASVTWEGATVNKLHDGLAKIVLHTRDEEIIVAGRSSSARRVITPAYLDGSDVWVFMRRKRKIGTNLWDYELAEQYIWGEKIEFTISRYVSGSTLPYHSDLLNTTNAATFLGLAAGFVTYLGVAQSLTNIAVAASRVSSMTWCFEYDSLGIIDLADASPGWNWTTDDLTSVGPGWVKASDLGLSSSALGTGDYSVFTA